jgi:hypothetical protein
MARALFLLALLLVPTAARAEAPRVVVRDDGTEVTGLPAISGDGSTIAYVEPFEASSDADLLSIAFVRVSDGATADRWIVSAAADDGSRLPPPADARGATAWRRARNLTLHLEREGYRAMAAIGGDDALFDASARTAPLRGEGLRIVQRRSDLTIHAARDGRVRWTGPLPAMSAYCGMSDTRPRDVPPAVRTAWVDASSRVVLVQYGHVYASCMCPSDLAFLPVTLAP